MVGGRRQGYVILELLATILLIGLGLMVLASLLFGTVRSVRADFEERAAREMAHGMVETLDARGAEKLVDGVQEVEPPFKSAKHLRDARCRIRRTTLKEAAYAVEAEVSWTDFTGRARVARVSSFVGREAP